MILNVTFLLSAGFKWGHEAIEKYGTYLHCLAWSIPLAQTVVALFLAKVDGNELTGKNFRVQSWTSVPNESALKTSDFLKKTSQNIKTEFSRQIFNKNIQKQMLKRLETIYFLHHTFFSIVFPSRTAKRPFLEITSFPTVCQKVFNVDLIFYDNLFFSLFFWSCSFVCVIYIRSTPKTIYTKIHQK